MYRRQTSLQHVVNRYGWIKALAMNLRPGGGTRFPETFANGLHINLSRICTVFFYKSILHRFAEVFILNFVGLEVSNPSGKNCVINVDDLTVIEQSLTSD
jgi:hypothetical protein